MTFTWGKIFSRDTGDTLSLRIQSIFYDLINNDYDRGDISMMGIRTFFMPMM